MPSNLKQTPLFVILLLLQPTFYLHADAPVVKVDHSLEKAKDAKVVTNEKPILACWDKLTDDPRYTENNRLNPPLQYLDGIKNKGNDTFLKQIKVWEESSNSLQTVSDYFQNTLKTPSEILSWSFWYFKNKQKLSKTASLSTAIEKAIEKKVLEILPKTNPFPPHIEGRINWIEVISSKGVEEKIIKLNSVLSKFTFKSDSLGEWHGASTLPFNLLEASLASEFILNAQERNLRFRLKEYSEFNNTNPYLKALGKEGTTFKEELQSTLLNEERKLLCKDGKLDEDKIKALKNLDGFMSLMYDKDPLFSKHMPVDLRVKYLKMVEDPKALSLLLQISRYFPNSLVAIDKIVDGKKVPGEKKILTTNELQELHQTLLNANNIADIRKGFIQNIAGKRDRKAEIKTVATELNRELTTVELESAQKWPLTTLEGFRDLIENLKKQKDGKNLLHSIIIQESGPVIDVSKLEKLSLFPNSRDSKVSDLSRVLNAGILQGYAITVASEEEFRKKFPTQKHFFDFFEDSYKNRYGTSLKALFSVDDTKPVTDIQRAAVYRYLKMSYYANNQGQDVQPYNGLAKEDPKYAALSEKVAKEELGLIEKVLSDDKHIRTEAIEKEIEKSGDDHQKKIDVIVRNWMPSFSAILPKEKESNTAFQKRYELEAKKLKDEREVEIKKLETEYQAQLQQFHQRLQTVENEKMKGNELLFTDIARQQAELEKEYRKLELETITGKDHSTAIKELQKKAQITNRMGQVVELSLHGFRKTSDKRDREIKGNGDATVEFTTKFGTKVQFQVHDSVLDCPAHQDDFIPSLCARPYKIDPKLIRFGANGWPFPDDHYFSYYKGNRINDNLLFSHLNMKNYLEKLIKEGKIEEFKEIVGILTLAFKDRNKDNAYAAASRYDLLDRMADAAIKATNEIFNLNGNPEKILITYNNDPKKLNAKAKEIQELVNSGQKDQALAITQKLVNGNQKEKEEFSQLQTYFKKFPDSSPSKILVLGESMPPHWKEFSNDAEIKELFQKLPKDIVAREWALHGAGLRTEKEGREQLIRRMTHLVGVIERPITKERIRDPKLLEEEKSQLNPYNAHRVLVESLIKYNLKPLAEVKRREDIEALLNQPLHGVVDIQNHFANEKQRDIHGGFENAVALSRSYLLFQLLDIKKVLEGKVPYSDLDKRLLDIIQETNPEKQKEILAILAGKIEIMIKELDNLISKDPSYAKSNPNYVSDGLDALDKYIGEKNAVQKRALAEQILGDTAINQLKKAEYDLEQNAKEIDAMPTFRNEEERGRYFTLKVEKEQIPKRIAELKKGNVERDDYLPVPLDIQAAGLTPFHEYLNRANHEFHKTTKDLTKLEELKKNLEEVKGSLKRLKDHPPYNHVVPVQDMIQRASNEVTRLSNEVAKLESTAKKYGDRRSTPASLSLAQQDAIKNLPPVLYDLLQFGTTVSDYNPILEEILKNPTTPIEILRKLTQEPNSVYLKKYSEKLAKDIQSRSDKLKSDPKSLEDHKLLESFIKGMASDPKLTIQSILLNPDSIRNFYDAKTKKIDLAKLQTKEKLRAWVQEELVKLQNRSSANTIDKLKTLKPEELQKLVKEGLNKGKTLDKLYDSDFSAQMLLLVLNITESGNTDPRYAGIERYQKDIMALSASRERDFYKKAQKPEDQEFQAKNQERLEKYLQALAYQNTDLPAERRAEILGQLNQHDDEKLSRILKHLQATPDIDINPPIYDTGSAPSRASILTSSYNRAKEKDPLFATVRANPYLELLKNGTSKQIQEVSEQMTPEFAKYKEDEGYNLSRVQADIREELRKTGGLSKNNKEELARLAKTKAAEIQQILIIEKVTGGREVDQDTLTKLLSKLSQEESAKLNKETLPLALALAEEQIEKQLRVEAAKDELLAYQKELEAKLLATYKKEKPDKNEAEIAAIAKKESERLVKKMREVYFTDISKEKPWSETGRFITEHANEIAKLRKILSLNINNPFDNFVKQATKSPLSAPILSRSPEVKVILDKTSEIMKDKSSKLPDGKVLTKDDLKLAYETAKKEIGKSLNPDQKKRWQGIEGDSDSFFEEVANAAETHTQKLRDKAFDDFSHGLVIANNEQRAKTRTETNKPKDATVLGSLVGGFSEALRNVGADTTHPSFEERCDAAVTQWNQSLKNAEKHNTNITSTHKITINVSKFSKKMKEVLGLAVSEELILLDGEKPAEEIKTIEMTLEGYRSLENKLANLYNKKISDYQTELTASVSEKVQVQQKIEYLKSFMNDKEFKSTHFPESQRVALRKKLAEAEHGYLVAKQIIKTRLEWLNDLSKEAQVDKVKMKELENAFDGLEKLVQKPDFDSFLTSQADDYYKQLFPKGKPLNEEFHSETSFKADAKNSLTNCFQYKEQIEALGKDLARLTDITSPEQLAKLPVVKKLMNDASRGVFGFTVPNESTLNKIKATYIAEKEKEEKRKPLLEKLAKHGITWDGGSTLNFSRFTVPKGSKLTIDESNLTETAKNLITALKEISPLLPYDAEEAKTRQYGVLEKHKDQWEVFKGAIIGQWNEKGRVLKMELDPTQAVVSIFETGYGSGYKFTITNKETEREKAAAVYAELEKLKKDNKAKLTDVGASHQHLLQVFYQNQVKGAHEELRKNLEGIQNKVNELRNFGDVKVYVGNDTEISADKKEAGSFPASGIATESDIIRKYELLTDTSSMMHKIDEDESAKVIAVGTNLALMAIPGGPLARLGWAGKTGAGMLSGAKMGAFMPLGNQLFADVLGIKTGSDAYNKLTVATCIAMLLTPRGAISKLGSFGTKAAGQMGKARLASCAMMAQMGIANIVGYKQDEVGHWSDQLPHVFIGAATFGLQHPMISPLQKVLKPYLGKFWSARAAGFLAGSGSDWATATGWDALQQQLYGSDFHIGESALEHAKKSWISGLYMAGMDQGFAARQSNPFVRAGIVYGWLAATKYGLHGHEMYVHEEDLRKRREAAMTHGDKEQVKEIDEELEKINSFGKKFSKISVQVASDPFAIYFAWNAAKHGTLPYTIDQMSDLGKDLKTWKFEGTRRKREVLRFDDLVAKKPQEVAAALTSLPQHELAKMREIANFKEESSPEGTELDLDAAPKKAKKVNYTADEVLENKKALEFLATQLGTTPERLMKAMEARTKDADYKKDHPLGMDMKKIQESIAKDIEADIAKARGTLFSEKELYKLNIELLHATPKGYQKLNPELIYNHADKDNQWQENVSIFRKVAAEKKLKGEEDQFAVFAIHYKPKAGETVTWDSLVSEYKKAKDPVKRFELIENGKLSLYDLALLKADPVQFYRMKAAGLPSDQIAEIFISSNPEFIETLGADYARKFNADPFFAETFGKFYLARSGENSLPEVFARYHSIERVYPLFNGNRSGTTRLLNEYSTLHIQALLKNEANLTKIRDNAKASNHDSAEVEKQIQYFLAIKI